MCIYNIYIYILIVLGGQVRYIYYILYKNERQNKRITNDMYKLYKANGGKRHDLAERRSVDHWSSRLSIATTFTWKLEALQHTRAPPVTETSVHTLKHTHARTGTVIHTSRGVRVSYIYDTKRVKILSIYILSSSSSSSSSHSSPSSSSSSLTSRKEQNENKIIRKRITSLSRSLSLSSPYF